MPRLLPEQVLSSVILMAKDRESLLELQERPAPTEINGKVGSMIMCEFT